MASLDMIQRLPQPPPDTIAQFACGRAGKGNHQDLINRKLPLKQQAEKERHELARLRAAELRAAGMTQQKPRGLLEGVRRAVSRVLRGQ